MQDSYILHVAPVEITYAYICIPIYVLRHTRLLTQSLSGERLVRNNRFSTQYSPKMYHFSPIFQCKIDGLYWYMDCVNNCIMLWITKSFGRFCTSFYGHMTCFKCILSCSCINFSSAVICSISGVVPKAWHEEFIACNHVHMTFIDGDGEVETLWFLCHWRVRLVTAIPLHDDALWCYFLPRRMEGMSGLRTKSPVILLPQPVGLLHPSRGKYKT